jgi:hypothetical protein
MIVVQLDVFSGRPNPRWQLSAREIRDLVDRVTADRSILLRRDADTGGLGYRGFIIEHSGEPDAWSQAGLPSAARIGGRGIADAGASGWLLGTSGSGAASIPQGALDHSQDSIRLGGRLLAPPEPCADSVYTSDTDFSYWNNAQHQFDNNCYNYASNKRTDTFAQPGLGTGHMYSEINCREVGTGARWDGWRGRCQPGHNLNVCLVIWPPGHDFHWYRLCQNGHWCHKPGGTKARNYDDSGNLITTPETADRGPYTVFCRYLVGWDPTIR